MRYCNHPVSIVRRLSSTVSLKYISSQTTDPISSILYRIVSLRALYQNCSNGSASLNKMAARAKNRKKSLNDI